MVVVELVHSSLSPDRANIHVCWGGHARLLYHRAKQMQRDRAAAASDFAQYDRLRAEMAWHISDRYDCTALAPLALASPLSHTTLFALSATSKPHNTASPTDALPEWCTVSFEFSFCLPSLFRSKPRARSRTIHSSPRTSAAASTMWLGLLI